MKRRNAISLIGLSFASLAKAMELPLDGCPDVSQCDLATAMRALDGRAAYSLTSSSGGVSYRFICVLSKDPAGYGIYSVEGVPGRVLLCGNDRMQAIGNVMTVEKEVNA
jgi:hypothetical protein